MLFLVDLLGLVGDGDIFKEYKEKYCKMHQPIKVSFLTNGPFFLKFC
jgi:hypothetical protein